MFSVPMMYLPVVEIPLGLSRRWNLSCRRNLLGRRFRVNSEARHSADEFRRNLRCTAEFRGNEHQHLLCRHSQFAVVRCLDAEFTGGPAHFGSPQIESEPIAVTCRLGKIDREMDGGGQKLVVMKQAWRTRGEAVFE